MHVRAVHVSCSIHRLVSRLEVLVSSLEVPACMEVMASSLEALVHYACLLMSLVPLPINLAHFAK